jgi:hypothetical protein
LVWAGDQVLWRYDDPGAVSLDHYPAGLDLLHITGESFPSGDSVDPVAYARQGMRLDAWRLSVQIGHAVDRRLILSLVGIHAVESPVWFI